MKATKPEPIVVSGELVGGQLKWNAGWKFAKLVIKRWPDCWVDITIAVREESRRKKQNNYYRGVVVKWIANETGQHADSVHEWLKLEHNATTIEMLDKRTGEVTEQKVPRSTVKLNVQEFCDYVDKCKLWAAEFLGIIVPEADPEYWRKEDRAA
jgi:hypothetical protein